MTLAVHERQSRHYVTEGRGHSRFFSAVLGRVENHRKVALEHKSHQPAFKSGFKHTVIKSGIKSGHNVYMILDNDASLKYFIIFSTSIYGVARHSKVSRQTPARLVSQNRTILIQCWPTIFEVGKPLIQPKTCLMPRICRAHTTISAQEYTKP